MCRRPGSSMVGVLRSRPMQGCMSEGALAIVWRWRFPMDRAVHRGPADTEQLGQLGGGVDARWR